MKLFNRQPCLRLDTAKIS